MDWWGTPGQQDISTALERTSELTLLLIETASAPTGQVGDWLRGTFPLAQVTVVDDLDSALDELRTRDHDLVLANTTGQLAEVESIVREVNRAFPHTSLMVVTDHPGASSPPSTPTGGRGSDGIEDDRLADTLLHGVQLARAEREAHARLVTALRLEKEAAERLREVNAAKGDLLATTSHELRTPLTVIAANAELLMDELELTTRQAAYVDAIVRNTARLATLTEELHQLARLGEPQSSGDMLAVDMGSIVRTASETLRPLWTAKRLDVQVDVGEEPSLVNGYARQLEHLVINLMSNAISFTDEDGTITCRVSTTPTDVILSVIDTGIGIPDSEQAQLFTKFFRGSHTGRHTVHGTGLGLHFAASIVEKHDGYIAVTSKVGSGSVFTVRLPRLRTPLEDTAASHEDWAPWPRSRSRSTMLSRLVAMLDVPGTDPEVHDIASMLQSALDSARDTGQWELLADAMHFAHRRLAVRGLTRADVDHICSVVEEAADPDLQPTERDRLHSHLAPRTTAAGVASPGAAQFNPVATTYLELLLGGDRAGAVEHARRHVDDGMDPADFYLDVLAPVQHEVGQLWARGLISVAQEHFCTSATQLVMRHLRPQMSPADLRGKRSLAVHAPGSVHRVGLRMVTDVLGCRGWHTTYIEDDITPEILVELLTLQRPDVLLLSASMPSQVATVRTLIENIRQGVRTRGVKIVVGGRPFVVAPDLAAAVGADGWAPDARTALDVCNELTADSDGRSSLAQ